MLTKNQPETRRKHAITAAVAEALESRRLLAGMEGGLLVARGTGGNDTISVRRSGTDDVIVTTNGVNQTFDLDDFTGVRLEGLGGNDTFDLIDALLTVSADDERHVTLLGGAGTDTVSYATRKIGLTFRRYEDDGFLSVTVSERGDRVDAAVERFIGGLADDRFEVDDRDRVLANPPEVTLEGGAGRDTFRPAYFMRATMLGGAGDDRFVLDDNVLRTSVSAGDGNDEIRLLNGGMPSVLDAGLGLDTMLASESTAVVIDMRPFAGLEDLRGAGTPTVEVFGNALDNQIISLLEGQRITVHGLGGDDTIVGTNGPDSLDGGEGDDILIGKDGNDTLDGGGAAAGIDTIDGGAGSNTNLNGEVIAGQRPYIAVVNRILTIVGASNSENFSVERVGIDDVFVRAAGRFATFDLDDVTGVSILGLGGNDVITVRNSLSNPFFPTDRATIDGGGGNDLITGSDNTEFVYGNFGADTLIGLGGLDVLEGDAGNDQLVGGLGPDTLDGGDNDDLLDAKDGVGIDTVIGGSGADTARIDEFDEVSDVETLA